MVITETLEDYPDAAPPHSFGWVELGDVLCEVSDHRAIFTQ